MSTSSEEGPAFKRHKSSPELEGKNMSQAIVDIIADGDIFLELISITGVDRKVSLRVSSHVLSISSPVFKSMLAHKASENVPLENEDEGAMVLLCNILHLQNNKLPARIPSELLYKLAVLADKYHCTVAIGRTTVQWFDRLYNSKAALDTFKMIETTYILDEPTYFARFTERWIRTEPIANKFVIRSTDPNIRRLAVELHNRRHALLSGLRSDIDILIDPCSITFSKTARHYMDYAPGMAPDPPCPMCRVDEQAGTEYLGALRDAHIWPATVWLPTLGEILDAIKEFRVPEYDDCDKCDFCEDTKPKFSLAVLMVKQMHEERLWGLCIDCFKAGGLNAGECRIEHSKPKL